MKRVRMERIVTQKTHNLISQAEAKSLTLEDYKAIFSDRIFKTQPRLHQFMSLLWGATRDRVLFLHDIGTGKTCSALLLAQEWGCKKILVVCPNSVRRTWREEIEKHTNLTFTDLTGSTEERKLMVGKSNTDIHIINYEGLKHVWGRKVKGKSKHNKYIVCDHLIAEAGYDCLVCDEFHRIKNWEALQTQVVFRLSMFANKVVFLSGTPIGRDASDFWAEMMVLDNGTTLGNSWSDFFNTYCSKFVMNVKGHHFYAWSVSKKNVDIILEKIAPIALRFEASECYDLPEVIRQIRHVEMTPEQAQLTDAVVHGLKVELENGTLNTENVLSKASKLSQISGGFIILSKGVEKLKVNPKLDELIRILEEFEGKCIIFHNFIAAGEGIEARLKKEHIQFRSLRGGITDPDRQYREFKDNPDVRVLVAHPKSGGEGQNLQEANVLIIYDQIYSGAITRPQIEGRIVRSGQKQRCLIIDLIAKCSGKEIQSIDERIYATAKDQKDVAFAILKWISDFME